MRQLFTALFVCFFLSSALAQSTVYVTPTGSGNQSGGSWSDAISGTQLQSRLASASAGTQFWIAGGRYKPTTGTDRTLSFFIPSGVQVYGGFIGTETTLGDRKATRPYSTVFSGYLVTGTDEQSSYHVVTFRNANTDTQLDGVSIIYGRANGTSNFNNVGAGVYNDGSNGGRSEPTLVNCEIRGNTADSHGGGVYNNGQYGVCTSRFVNCSIEGNSSTGGYGGGMYNNGFQGVCNPQLTNCIIASNRAAQGSAITSDGSQGLSSPVITNCVFKYNQGGSVLHGRGFNGNCQPRIINSILWTNSRPSFYAESANHLVTYSDIEDSYSGTGNISQDPQFFNYYTNDFRLLKISPAIDAGDPNSTSNSVSPTDFDGKSRFYKNRVDMGIIEYVPNYVTGIVRVTPSGSGDYISGSSWDNALSGTTLRSALSEAAPGTSFWIASGVYKPTISTDRTVSFSIPSGVQVYGGFTGNEADVSARSLAKPSSTTLSGDIGELNATYDNSYHVVSFSSVSASTLLYNVVITKGTSSDDNFSGKNNSGGGIINLSSNNISSAPTISRCIITANYSRNGGGIYSELFGSTAKSLTAKDCDIDGNNAVSGGGIYSYGGPITLINCRVRYNSATSSGGGINNNGSFRDSSPTLVNCLIAGNSADNGGGYYEGIGEGSTNGKLYNCLFINNSAQNKGGGVCLSGSQYSGIHTQFANCIIRNNLGSISPDVYSQQAYSSFTYSNIQGGFSGIGNIDADPLFVDASNGDYRLKAGSPSINTGDPNSMTSTVLATDLAGNQRIAENRIDMGAYEFQVSAVTGSDLSLRLSVDRRTPGTNQVVTYQLTVTNDGPIKATGVMWQNRLPDNMAFVGGSNLSLNNGILNGSIATLEPGASNTFTYQLQATQTGQYINAAQITAADQPDPDSQPNSGTGDGQDDASQIDIWVGGASSPVYASANPNQVPLPPVQSNQPTPDPSKVDLALSMSVDNRTPRVGDLLTYVMTITNQGGATASNVRVTAYLPDGQEFAGSGDGLSVSDGGVSGGTASIPAGGQVSVRFTARVTAAKMGVTKAQIRQASPADVDSTPDNGTDNGEDDTAQVDLRSLTGS